jgi:hypothetical protein
VLRAVYPDLLQWDWNFPNPYKWNVWLSLDGGATYILPSDYWMYGDARQFAPDGGGEPHYIVGVDESGREITAHSNAVRPDDAPVPGLNLIDGLVAHFGFEESSGNRMDDVHGYALAPVNLEPNNADGIIGNAVWFDGSGGYLSGTEETTAFSPTANGFAVSVWVSFENTVDPWETAYLASVWHDTDWPTGSSWHICSSCPATGNITVEMLGYSMSGFSTSGNLSGWAHVCLVFDAAAGQWSLYLNGTLGATSQYDYRPESGQLGVGLHTNPITPPPDSTIDELAIWSRALSAAEVAQLYNNGSGLPYELF